MRALCPRCFAPLVPALSGPRCPRMAACGYGGLVEAGRIHHELSAAKAEA